MGRKLTKAEKLESASARVFDFVDGPKNGHSMRLVNPPPKFLRLAFPEWCTYEYDETIKKFIYVGTEPPIRSGWWE